MSQSDYVVTMSAVNPYTSRLNPDTTQVAALVMACSQRHKLKEYYSNNKVVTDNFKDYFNDDNKDVLFNKLLQWPYALKGLDCAYKNLDKALNVYCNELAIIDPNIDSLGLYVAKERALVNTLIRTSLVKPYVTTTEKLGVYTVSVIIDIDEKRWKITFQYKPTCKHSLPTRIRTEVNGIDINERPVSGEVATWVDYILDKTAWSVFNLELARIDGKLVA